MIVRWPYKKHNSKFLIESESNKDVFWQYIWNQKFEFTK